jgi:hypothetical protein
MRRFGSTERVLCAWAEWFPTAESPPDRLSQKGDKRPEWLEVVVQQWAPKKAKRWMGLMQQPQIWYQVKFSWADVHWVPDEYLKPLPEPKKADKQTEADKKKEKDKNSKSKESSKEKEDHKTRSRR